MQLEFLLGDGPDGKDKRRVYQRAQPGKFPVLSVEIEDLLETYANPPHRLVCLFLRAFFFLFSACPVRGEHPAVDVFS